MFSFHILFALSTGWRFGGHKSGDKRHFRCFAFADAFGSSCAGGLKLRRCSLTLLSIVCCHLCFGLCFRDGLGKLVIRVVLDVARVH